VRDVARAAGDALVVVTSRGATTIDDAGSDFYGAGTSRHVPLVVVGPNVRAGIVSGQSATSADVPATVLFGLGVPSKTDFADGTQALAGASSAPVLAPRSSFAGHVLLRAYAASPLHRALEGFPPPCVRCVP
jgi:arylsulfatase A-like enzyme